MADLPDRAIRGSLKGCSGWIKYMSFDTKCWWRGGRSGRSPASWGWRASPCASMWSRRLPRGKRRLGREPVIMLRAAEGGVHVLANRCAHRGTLLCWQDRGSGRKSFQCSWRHYRSVMTARA